MDNGNNDPNPKMMLARSYLEGTNIPETILT